ncbi:hypothetical protein LCGC14_1424440 [marine sediment metagenome]|uniref:Uncharacterized protein n=1 Tax=marine sediment metagenome TaxID=412755 RepID=A0A0F9JQT9_9ZZZZ
MNDGWSIEMTFAPARDAYHLVVKKSGHYASIMVDRNQTVEDFIGSTTKAVELAMKEMIERGH